MANPLKTVCSPKGIVCIVILIGLLMMPMIFGQFYVRLITRVLIFGLAAISLDILVGYTGLVSFGHAAFLGIGMYVVGILAFNGFEAAIVAWPLAVILSGMVAAVIGFISLRTRGMYFIMITMAFARCFIIFFQVSRNTAAMMGFQCFPEIPWGQSTSTITWCFIMWFLQDFF